MTDLSSQARILQALRDARQRIEALEQKRDDRMAIIGMAGRFPGADDLEAFWQMLREGRSGIRFLSDDELRQSGEDPARFGRDDYVRAHAGISDPDGFDAAFFGYAPRDAEILDPQHRVFLEAAWAALEDAGHDPARHEGRIGVYAGAALNSHLIRLSADARLRADDDRVQIVIGNVLGLMPTRVSYHLDLKGPSIGIQTGCSTSLVAVHTACRSLANGECDMALAGAVTIADVRPLGYVHQPGGIASPDGRCRAFDASGQGTVFGSGVGVVVLKRLSAALADGDHIHAVIRGSAVNNDGASKVSLIAPSVGGQAAVIRAAFEAAGVDPASVDAIEAHGTATALGDPIEVAALHKVLTPAFKGQKACVALGSVKSNVGHLDAAAGMAGLFKAVLALTHEELPPSLGFEKANAEIDFQAGPLVVNTALKPWPRRDERPRRAGISSFGMGGTNAHLVLEEAPAMAEKPAEALAPRSWQVLPLSARTATALDSITSRLHARLSQGQLALGDVAYTLQTGRRAFQERRAIVARDSAGALEELATPLDGPRRFSGRAVPAAPLIAFLFPGQGSQQVNMARALYEQEPVFRATLDECAAHLADRLPLLDLLFPPAGHNADEAAARLRQTAHAQPALFAVELALARQWMAWGVQPQALLGHSVGEYVAACVAGVFDLGTALRLVALRGQLMQACAPGAMLAVMLPEAALTERLQQRDSPVELAAVNGPRQCVVAGPSAAIAALQTQLEGEGTVCHVLATSHAFHSAAMEPALQAFGEAVRAASLSAPAIPVVSNLTGGWLSAAQATDPAYWVRQLRHAVRFNDGLSTLCTLDAPLLIEMGPGGALSQLARQHAAGSPTAGPIIPVMDTPREADRAAAIALARLWQAGVTIDWPAVHQGRFSRRVPLPTYPFEHQPERPTVPGKEATTPPASTSMPAVESGVSAITTLPHASAMEEWFHLPAWQPAPLAAPHHAAGQRWLLCADTATCDALIPHLTGIDVVMAAPGDDIDLAATARGGFDQVVLQGQAASLPALFARLRSWHHRPSARPMLLSLLTTGAQRIGGREAIAADQAALQGAAQVASQEMPWLRTRVIDLAHDAGLAFDPGSIPDLARELREPWKVDARHVALRHGARWQQGYQACPLPEPSPQKGLASPWRQGGVYLIVGDLVEGLGMVYAKALARDHQARLVLVGRAGLPAAHAWDGWVAMHGPHHPVSGLIRQLQALRASNVEFRFLSGSLEDRGWLADVVQGAVAEFGALNGVLHAGVMGDHASATIPATDEAELERLHGGKIRAFESLIAVLSKLPPMDFVLHQSSLSAVAGGAGFAAYAAASAQLDALVVSRPGATPWVSINWDAVRTEDQGDQPMRSGSQLMDDALSADEVWATTTRVLAQPRFPRVVITRRSLSERLAKAFADPSHQPVATPARQTPSPDRPRISTPYVAPRNPTEAFVATALGDLLGIAQVGIDDDFFELGGQSLLAIQAVTRLRKEYGVELPMRALLFEARTASGIARLIDQQRAPAEVTLAASGSDDELESLLAQVEQLSPDEAARRL